LQDVRINDKGLKISPLEDDTPPEAKLLKSQTYGLLPHVKITDLLLEVDRWTNFTRHFTHLKSAEPATDRALLLTAILADAFNLGLEKMAEACPGTSLGKLAWQVAWHIRDESYSKGLAELVNAQHKLPFAAYWGEGTTSSSDGQRFRAGGHGESASHRNAKYGSEPGVLFYTHLSDQYAPFYTKVINANVRDATHVLDGLLYHESQLRIEEHYTDTAGFTDQVFALCHMLGFEFAPRIADLADKRLYVPGQARQLAESRAADRWRPEHETHGATVRRGDAPYGVDQAGHRDRVADPAETRRLSAPEQPGNGAARIGVRVAIGRKTGLSHSDIASGQ
jgi:hypothetical protein